MGALRERGLTLKLADDGRRLLASFGPPAQAFGEASLGLLSGELAEQFPGLFIFEQLLPEAINKIRAGTAFEIIIGELRDGEVQVLLDADKMAAHLNISPPCGGAHVTREQAGKAIERAGVVFGLDHEAVEQDPPELLVRLPDAGGLAQRRGQHEQRPGQRRDAGGGADLGRLPGQPVSQQPMSGRGRGSRRSRRG